MTRLVTLTTDFGPGSSYVAAMKGVMFGINPAIRLVDLGHRIPAQDLRFAAVFLQNCLPYFPEDSLHVVVVDPGVGSSRAILYVELPRLQLLVPDNGCWTTLPGADQPRRVNRVTNRQYWRNEISDTFHGRDIFAPVAAHLSLGLDPELLGDHPDQWQRFSLPAPVLSESEMTGEVLFIDDFGNLLTNLPGELLRQWSSDSPRVTLKDMTIPQVGRTYADAPPGAALVLVSSMDTVEIAVNQGNAAQHFGVVVGDRVQVIRGNPS
jgi:S-adenosylmethionine hydrolase